MSGRIIAINGRIGSGKDTVGKIIQYLVFCKHFGFKDDAFDPYPKSTYVLGGWEIKKFAGKLKQIAAILLGDPYFVENWERGSKEYRNEYLPEWGMTRREFLLDLGTKSLRDNFHRDVHVISLFADYTEDKNWLITDLRFANEFDGCKKRKALNLRVKRDFSKVWPEQWNRYSKGKYNTSDIGFIEWLRDNDEEVFKIVTHLSEISLLAHEFDYEIDNNGTIEELIEQVKQILIIENIL
jgi:hypothetical protein